MEKQNRQLDIYIDESGNFDNYSKSNLIYAVSFVMVDSNDDNVKPIYTFKTKLLNIFCGNHFVHTGNLVRGEKPYVGMFLKERQDLFYILFLLSKYSKYKVTCSVVEKKNISKKLYECIAESIFDTIKEAESYICDFDNVLIHYDNGQDFLRQTLIKAFEMCNVNVFFLKTLQQENPFMQVADMFSYFELIKYKIAKSGLSKNEITFFGTPRKIKKDYLNQLEEKYLYINKK